jgi:hypothetical protein
MLLDRRTYRIIPGHWNEALATMSQIRQFSREELRRDFEIQSPLYGPFQTIAFEMAFDDDAEQTPFFQKHFYPALQERGLFEGWFSHVIYADGHNLKTVDGDSVPPENAAQAPRPGMMIHRQYFEPLTHNGVMEGSVKILEETQKQFHRGFRIRRFHHSGTMTSVFWEFCYLDRQDQQDFEAAWNAHLGKNGMLDEFASLVRLGCSELWYSHP